MAIIGTRVNSKKQQQISAELETIIEDFSRSMRYAYKPFIGLYEPQCEHDQKIAFTPGMKVVWFKYVEWCRKNG